jgi:hypothetical protein
MRYRSGALVCWVLLLSLFVGSLAAKPPNPSGPRGQVFANDAGAKSPSEEQVKEIWKKLVTLMSSNGGRVSKKDFEKAFDMKFVEFLPPIESNATVYQTHQGVDWMLDVRISSIPYQDGAVSGEYSGMSVQIRKAKEDPCLPVSQAADDLRKEGWVGGVGTGPFYVFERKGSDYKVSLGALDGCFDSVSEGRGGNRGYIKYRH